MESKLKFWLSYASFQSCLYAAQTRYFRQPFHKVIAYER